MFNLEFLLKYIDIILLLLLVIFLFFTFKRLLGKKVGYTKTETESSTKTVDNSHNNKEVKEATQAASVNYPVGSLAYTLDLIKQKDKGFNENKFIESAKKAFELIVNNFASGNIEKIKPFVSEALYEYYMQLIKQRELTEEKSFVEIKEFLITDIYDAEILTDGNALIKIKFLTRQIRESYFKEDEISRFNKNNIRSFSEIWSFSKNLNDNVSIWKLVKITGA